MNKPTTTGVRCRHCKTRKASCKPCGMLTRRGLCNHCGSNPSIRDQYATVNESSGPTMEEMDALVAANMADIPKTNMPARELHQIPHTVQKLPSHRKRR